MLANGPYRRIWHCPVQHQSPLQQAMGKRTQKEQHMLPHSRSMAGCEGNAAPPESMGVVPDVVRDAIHVHICEPP
jgi:hypothetical protein